MNAELSRYSVLQPTSWCTIREQEDRYLVYNSRTDEMHLVPPTGFYAYGLCDGSRTVDEVGADLGKVLPGDPAALLLRLRDFLGGLVERGILEVADEP